MPKDKKDKVIYALVIIVVMLLSNNLVKNKTFKDNTNDEKVSLISDESINDEQSSEQEQDNQLTTEDIKVYISGEIIKPGVYTVNDGDRLVDLIDMAGGLSELANDKNLNLAQKLEDQMKIYIPNINEKELVEAGDTNSSSINTDDSSKKLININLASKEELMTLPNIGEKRAEAIIEYRQTNKFNKIEDIKNVTGIGEKYYEALKDLISV